MYVSEVIALVKEWVEEHASTMPDFAGVYLIGSVNFRALDEVFPGNSDVDIHIVLHQGVPKPVMEVAYKGLILECGFRGIASYEDIEEALSSLDIAANLYTGRILSDPTGVLRSAHRAIAAEFSHRKWVLARFKSSHNRVSGALQRLEAADDPAQQAASIYIALMTLGGSVAAAFLAPPTNRKSLMQMRQLLEPQQRIDLADKALAILGSVHLSKEQVEAHLQRTIAAFDRALEVQRTPIPLGGHKMQAHVRPYLVGGVQEMIDAGYHREAMGWTLLFHCASYAVIRNDAPEKEKEKFQIPFDQLVQDLGLQDAEMRQGRIDELRSFVDEVFAFCEEWIERNPELED